MTQQVGKANGDLLRALDTVAQAPFVAEMFTARGLAAKLKAAQAATEEPLFAQLDKDSDGVLSAAEFTAFATQHVTAEQAARCFSYFDPEDTGFAKERFEQLT